MSPQPRYAVPTVPDALKGLLELALDMRWSWSHYGDEVWEKLDPGLWDVTHNPWLLLQTISQTRLEEFARDPDFRKLLHHHLASRRRTLEARTWFQESHPVSARGASAMGPIAYFSMEFGLSEALPIYSGGLGILAGDFLKASSDLGLPVVGRRTPLPAGLLPPGARCPRRADRVLPVQRSRPAAGHAGARQRR